MGKGLGFLRAYSLAAGAIWLIWSIAVPQILLSLTPDGSAGNFGKAAILAALSFCVSFGLLHFFKKILLRPLFQSVSLFLTTLLIAMPLTAEGVFRAAIFFNVPGFRSPQWYADYAADESYWELERVWRHRYIFPKGLQVQPLLGWSQQETAPGNPLGLQADSLARLKKDGRRKILFYGDSFVKGRADQDHQLPRYLQARIPDADVLDLGVGGYGTDQIYLMFRETHQLTDKPFVLLGVLMNDDMNRAGLKFRTYWKPHFTFSALEELELQGVPVTPRQDVRPRIFSYAAAFMRIRLGFVDRKKNFLKRLNALLVEKVHRDCSKGCGGLTYVLFYDRVSIHRENWQERAMKSELEKQGIEYIDTKPLLLRYAKEHGLESTDVFYDPNDGHHNNLGNKVIGEGLLKYLAASDFLSVSAPEAQSLLA